MTGVRSHNARLVIRQAICAIGPAMLLAASTLITSGAQVTPARAQTTGNGQSALTFSPRPLPATVLAALPKWSLTSDDWLKKDWYDLRQRVLSMHSERELWIAAVRTSDPVARVIIAEDRYANLSDPEAVLQTLEAEPVGMNPDDITAAEGAADAVAAAADDAAAAAANDAAAAAADAAAGFENLTPKQREARERWLRPLAEAGDPRAQALLGALLEESESESIRRAGRALITLAALGGLRPAMRELAFLDHLESLSDGQPLSDPQNLGRWNERLAELGDSRAMIAFADELDTGRFGRRDPALATRWLERAAEAGEPLVFGELGFRSLAGIGTRQDATVAARWFRQGVEAGDETSMIQLALLHRRGEGVPVDLREYVLLVRQAANLGNSTGMVLLGYALLTGQGVEQNREAAIGWFRRAAHLGNGDGMLALAHQLEEGTSLIRPRPSEALYWYQEALYSGELSPEEEANASDRAMALEARGIRPTAPDPIDQ